MDLSLAAKPDYCSGYNKSQKNSIYGDALLDAPGCLSRSNEPYPRYWNMNTLLYFQLIIKHYSSIRHYIIYVEEFPSPDIVRTERVSWSECPRSECVCSEGARRVREGPACAGIFFHHCVFVGIPMPLNSPNPIHECLKYQYYSLPAKG